MIETPPETSVPASASSGSRMQGRQIFSYYVLLFVFLILTKALFTELNSRFNLDVFPTIAEGVQQALDNEAAFDSVINTIFSLLYAFLFSLPVAIVYRVTKEEERFDPALGQTIVLLAMVVTAVIVVISGDLARAFGLAGVVAAVRFRNTLDDAKDAVYVFLAIAIGMACGAKAFTVALWTSIIMTASLYFMWRYQFGRLSGRIVAMREHDKKDKKGSKGKKEKKAEKAGKKSNADILVEARDQTAARKHTERILAENGGSWRLAGVRGSEGGAGTLQFVGRLSKHAEPQKLVEAVLRGSGDIIQNVTFRSLKKGKATSPEEAVPSTDPDDPGAATSPDADSGQRRDS